MRDDRGSATPLVVMVVVLTLAVGSAALAVGNFAVARARASSVADAAALAGASHDLEGDQCAAAAKIVSRSSANLLACRIEGLDVLVTVVTPAPAILRRLAAAAGESAPDLTVSARAGPP